MYLQTLVSTLLALTLSLPPSTATPAPDFGEMMCLDGQGKPGGVKFCTSPDLGTGCHYRDDNQCIGFQIEIANVRSLRPDPKTVCKIYTKRLDCSGPTDLDNMIKLSCPGIVNMADGVTKGMSIKCSPRT
ncbi:hypothetical protein EK21DRAFT_110800 [Setomelanomma holmii]|uniref:Uncharacterized protein n=1 Tax=Setomelanomma holmii TaxID=210430 RepID=A0A9P4HB22_9PLEO|nr:hypothetical protein EK21DRAFT_110800 [Setomelanomma holmii]